MATWSETAVATPIFCSMTSTAISPSSAERDQHPLDLVDDDRRQALGRLVHDQRRGSPSSARAIASICCSPPEAARRHCRAARRAAGRSGRSRSMVQAASRRRRAASRRCSSTVRLRPDAPALRHIADAQTGDLVRLERRDLAAGDADRAAAGPLQPDDGVAERGLAHAVAADDRQHAGAPASATRPAAHGIRHNRPAGRRS